MRTRVIRVYADTSVFGGVFDDEFAKPSAAFMQQVMAGMFELCVSPLVLEEIERGPGRVREYLVSVMYKLSVLPVTPEAEQLQVAYMAAGIVGASSANDALHVAIASVNQCQLIVSWNFRHIVHFSKIGLYNAVNELQHYPAIGIYSPQQVAAYDES